MTRRNRLPLLKAVALAGGVSLAGCQDTHDQALSERIAQGAVLSVVNVATLADGGTAFTPVSRGQLRSLGTGFAIAPGRLLTNAHVVAGQGPILLVRTGENPVPAHVEKADAGLDVALLTWDPDTAAIPTLDLSSAPPRLGQWVMAIGNPFGLEASVSVGIVSATDRALGDGPLASLIQTDAAINPGNSGGPLVDAEGRVVAMNVAVIGRIGGSQGIGFAIPAARLRAFLEEQTD